MSNKSKFLVNQDDLHDLRYKGILGLYAYNKENKTVPFITPGFSVRFFLCLKATIFEIFDIIWYTDVFWPKFKSC